MAGHIGPERVDHLVEFGVVGPGPERHRCDTTRPGGRRKVRDVAGPFELEARTQGYEPDRRQLREAIGILSRRLDLDVAEARHPFEQGEPNSGGIGNRRVDRHARVSVTHQQCDPDELAVDQRHPRPDFEWTHHQLDPTELVTYVGDVTVGFTPPRDVLRIDHPGDRCDVTVDGWSYFDLTHGLIVAPAGSGGSGDFSAPYHHVMSRMRFGTFLAPHHPTGEHPTLQFQRDIEFAEHLDRLGFDEFWCGEHHSSGWEMIASPEMFLAGAAQRTHNIMLGTGVTSLPYHHPFNVAQRIVQLDHMSRGRAMFGSGPGALASDARTLGIDPMVQRDRQDEALSVITRLLRGDDRFSYDSEWFTLNDARLQLLPLQEELPMVTASSISPSGMTLAGKYGMGVLSIASNSTAGLQALPTQWGFAEDAAAEHGQTVDRKNWRVMLAFHIAESREQARNEAVDGLHRWHNEYNVWTLGRPNATHVDDKWELLEQTVGDGSPGAGAGVIGTPDDLVAAIRHLQDITGGFGVVLGFAHDWANREATMRSWDLVARYVIPEINGYTAGLRESQEYLNRHQAELMAGASQAVVSKILANDKAAAAMQTTMEQAAEAAAAKEAKQSEFRPGGGLPTSVD